MGERPDADSIAADLADCRQRGLDWLDRRASNQVPVRAAALQQLAEDYVVSRRMPASGRIAQIKTLLQCGIAEFAEQGHQSDATLLRDLFFGESFDGPIRPATELLKRAQKRVGDSDTRFRERRANVMRSFALFLLDFAGQAPGDLDGAAEDDLSAERHQQLAATGYVADGEHFIQLLTRAVNVTIVGITNQHLAEMLKQALRRKRAGGRPSWDSLRIVFLGKALLHAVNDEREEVQDPHDALRQRRQDAAWARRSVEVVLKDRQSTHWTIYNCPYLPGLTGALFELDDGRKIAHLLMRRPRQPTKEHLYVDLEDSADRFSAVFEDIVRNSDRANMVVPVGFPVDGTFRRTTARLHRNVLKDGSGAVGWLPMVLVITSRRRGHRVEPLLQLRTQDNSARELRRLSHLAGHVLQDDRLQPATHPPPEPATSFTLADETPLSAAQRIVQDVTGDDLASAMQPVTTGSYLYRDKEHLFFFVFFLDLPESIQFPRRAEMHGFSLSELLAVRKNQVVRCAAQLCRTAGLTQRARSAAAEVVALNLILHEEDQLAEQVRSLAGQGAEELARLAPDIDQQVTDRMSPSWTGHDVPIHGLAGWQYREFFAKLLPVYAQFHIDGASDLLEAISRDARKSEAVDRLSALYQDEHLIAASPIEL